MLGKLTRQDKPHSGLDLPGGDSRLLVVPSQLRRLLGKFLEDIVNEAIHDPHRLARYPDVRVDLLQHFEDVDLVGLHALLRTLLLLVAGCGRTALLWELFAGLWLHLCRSLLSDRRFLLLRGLLLGGLLLGLWCHFYGSNRIGSKEIKEWLAAEERYKQDVQMKNILPAVADKFLVDHQADQRGASILCFDEIQTVDVFAIVALSGIVSRLLSTGTVLVATSNRAPNDLNQDGMQWEIFLNFVSKLEEHCENVLIGSEIDYRRLIGKRSIDQVHYFWPLDSIALKEYEKIWYDVTNQFGGRITSNTIPVMFGRTFEVPESCNGVARFTFDYLCGRPVGAADYIAIANNYHTVFISDIPMMSMRIRDRARRFITLIDELYNHHCCLYCTAASSIDDLFQGTEEGTLFDLESFQFETEIEGGKLRRNVLAEGNVGSGGAPSGIMSMLSGQQEIFAFRRAVSRLIEMQTPLYLEGVHYLHPYFQNQPKDLKNNHASKLKSRSSS